MNIEIQTTAEKSIHSIPSWNIPENEVNTSLLEFSHKKINTDGSKTPSDYAIVSGQAIQKVKLHQKASVLFCEHSALRHDMEITAFHRNKNFAISCDSINAITAIHNRWTNDTAIQDCHMSYREATLKNNSVTIIWVPSHVGIVENETAYKATKEAANSLSSNQFRNNLPLETLTHTLK